MGKINGCLKCLFIFFNVLFAIIGCLLIFGAVKTGSASGQFSSMGTPGIEWVWIFSIGILGISCLGIYAGCSEKPLALKIFAGFMVAGIIVMLIFGIFVAVSRNKIKHLFTDVGSDASKILMQNEGFRSTLNDLQATVMCCGLTNAEDWGSVIPASCSCDRSSSGACKASPRDTTGPNQIYATTCGEYILNFIDLFLNITMGFCFGFAVTALLGLLVTLLMLHQIKRHEGEGPAMSMKNY